jgi:inner membrane transporter RhtA
MVERRAAGSSPLVRGAGATRVPPWGLAVTAMVSIQLASALSVHLGTVIGAAGTAWLRLSAGALIYLAVTRPPLRSVRRGDIPVLVGLGVTTGLQTVVFLAAIQRLPLGTAVAVELLGPMMVAAAQSGTARGLVWPLLALCGVCLLTRPWSGDVNFTGIGFALLSATGWASYILLTQRIGDRFSGIQGLSMTMPISALTAACVGIPEAAGHFSPLVVAEAVGIAVISPVVPYACEMAALRQMTTRAFGTLMALEPAFGCVLGILILGQHFATTQVLGAVLVVAAGAAAQRGQMPQVRDRVVQAELSVLCKIAAAKLVKATGRAQARKRVDALEALNTQLRQQVHEYANHLQALSGLYELGDAAAASQLLAQMVGNHEDSPVMRVSQVEDPVVAGTLVALMRAAEQRRIRLDLNPRCRVRRLPATLSALDVVTIIANCVGNALDAVSELDEDRRRRVVLMVLETAHDLRLTVRDWGPGLEGRAIDELTRAGVSSKPGHHGVGLTLVSEIAAKRGGRLSLRSLHPGALLTISLPWS